MNKKKNKTYLDSKRRSFLLILLILSLARLLADSRNETMDVPLFYSLSATSGKGLKPLTGVISSELNIYTTLGLILIEKKIVER